VQEWLDFWVHLIESIRLLVCAHHRFAAVEGKFMCKKKKPFIVAAKEKFAANMFCPKSLCLFQNTILAPNLYQNIISHC
jgi:hypothetical protein